jgi:hypothetical protein
MQSEKQTVQGFSENRTVFVVRRKDQAVACEVPPVPRAAQPYAYPIRRYGGISKIIVSPI